MPYITQEQRQALNWIQRELNIETPGELNYLITVLIHKYLKEHGVSYTNLNAAIGVLEAAKLELYRTVVAHYEDTKRKMNGEVSNLTLSHHYL